MIKKIATSLPMPVAFGVGVHGLQTLRLLSTVCEKGSEKGGFRVDSVKVMDLADGKGHCRAQ